MRPIILQGERNAKVLNSALGKHRFFGRGCQLGQDSDGYGLRARMSILSPKKWTSFSRNRSVLPQGKGFIFDEAGSKSGFQSRRNPGSSWICTLGEWKELLHMVVISAMSMCRNINSAYRRLETGGWIDGKVNGFP